jgi:DNA helicase II / ATP-dependent DNA helicase PcrA
VCQQVSYRMPSHLLTATSKLIAHNRVAKSGEVGTGWDPTSGKEMKGLHHMAKSTLSRIMVQEAWDNRDEARWVAKKIAELAKASLSGRPLSCIAVMSRCAWQLQDIERALLEKSLPYQLIRGGAPLCSAPRCRDAIALLRVLTEPADDAAFESVAKSSTGTLGPAAARVIGAVKGYAAVEEIG